MVWFIDVWGMWFCCIQVRQFFIAEIVTQPNQKAQVVAIKRAIWIAQFCYSYNNFNSAMEILSALCNPKITCLEKVWEVRNINFNFYTLTISDYLPFLFQSLDSKLFKILEELSESLASSDNYQNYRNLLNGTPNPCVPLLGVHTGDIRFIDDFNQTEIVDLMNVEKLLLLSKELRKLKSLQGAEYSFSVDLQFRARFIENFCHISEMLNGVPTLENNQSSNERVRYLRSLYENAYSDINAYGKEDFNLSLMQLRSRDWSVLTTYAKRQVVEANEVIYEQEIKTNNPSIVFLKEGKVIFKRNGIILRNVKAPAIIGALNLLDSIDTSFEVVSVTDCIIELVEERFLISLLESDCELSMRFFTELCFQLVAQLNDTTTCVVKNDGDGIRLRSSSKVEPPQFLNKHLVVKPLNAGSNPCLSLDPKLLRDRQFRQLFNFSDDEVLIKGMSFYIDWHCYYYKHIEIIFFFFRI